MISVTTISHPSTLSSFKTGLMHYRTSAAGDLSDCKAASVGEELYACPMR